MNELQKKGITKTNLLAMCWFMLLSCAVNAGTPGVEFGLHFDEQGNIIRPDEVFLGRGVKDDKAGYKASAMKNFKISASYGNAYAKYFLGLLYLQQNDYISGHAWLSLLDKEFKGADKVNRLLPKVTANLSPEQAQKAKGLLAELKENYGEYAALLKREKWRKSHKYTGTHIRGHIPNFLKIEVGNGVTVTGTELKKQIETFVYEYEYQFRLGDVKLQETEYIDEDEAADNLEEK